MDCGSCIAGGLTGAALGDATFTGGAMGEGVGSSLNSGYATGGSTRDEAVFLPLLEPLPPLPPLPRPPLLGVLTLGVRGALALD